MGTRVQTIRVVNALSTWLTLRIWRNGKEHFVEFRNGVPVAPLAVVGHAEGKRGTELTFQVAGDTVYRAWASDLMLREHRTHGPVAREIPAAPAIVVVLPEAAAGPGRTKGVENGTEQESPHVPGGP